MFFTCFTLIKRAQYVNIQHIWEVQRFIVFFIKLVICVSLFSAPRCPPSLSAKSSTICLYGWGTSNCSTASPQVSVTRYSKLTANYKKNLFHASGICGSPRITVTCPLEFTSMWSCIWVVPNIPLTHPSLDAWTGWCLLIIFPSHDLCWVNPSSLRGQLYM